MLCPTDLLQTQPREKTFGELEEVAVFCGPMPTGVTVSHNERVFVCFPRWEDRVDFTVGELRDGNVVPYPDESINWLDLDRQVETFVSVQSVVVDPRGRLWALDTGSINFGPTTYGGPKLVGIDLEADRIFKRIVFTQDVALHTTYLNDVRFDLRRGDGGMAFITDSSDQGPNGIIVVDLASEQTWRRLNDHPSTKAVPQFMPVVEGQPMMVRQPDSPLRHLSLGADGIAISSDGMRLFYSPLASRRLYSVSVDALCDRNVSDEEVAATVIDHGDKGASDGLESDAEGRIYVTNYEHNAILRRLQNGQYESLVHDPRVLWPDTMSVAINGYLYFTANQLHRMARFNGGIDRREKPYSLFKIKVDANPVWLR